MNPQRLQLDTARCLAVCIQVSANGLTSVGMIEHHRRQVGSYGQATDPSMSRYCPKPPSFRLDDNRSDFDIPPALPYNFPFVRGLQGSSSE